MSEDNNSSAANANADATDAGDDSGPKEQLKPLFEALKESDNAMLSFAEGFRDKVKILFEHFDNDTDGRLKYDELAALQTATADDGYNSDRLSKEMYVVACQSLNCYPNEDLSLEALKFTYAADGSGYWGPDLLPYLEHIAEILHMGNSNGNDNGNDKSSSEVEFLLAMIYLDRACSLETPRSNGVPPCPFCGPRTVQRLGLAALVVAKRASTAVLLRNTNTATANVTRKCCSPSCRRCWEFPTCSSSKWWNGWWRPWATMACTWAWKACGPGVASGSPSSP